MPLDDFTNMSIKLLGRLTGGLNIRITAQLPLPAA
jgi:hypothetical protein